MSSFTRAFLVALVPCFGIVTAVLWLNMSQVSLLPRDANAQVVLAAVPFAEMQQALQSQVRASMRTPEEYAQAAQQWRDRATRMDAAVAAVREQHPAVATAWRGIKPSIVILGIPAPKSFSEVWPDGSITPSESAELYRQEFAAAAAEANHGMTAFARALEEANDATAATTETRVRRLQDFNAWAMGAELLLLVMLIVHVVRTLRAEKRAMNVAQRELASSADASANNRDEAPAASEAQMELLLKIPDAEAFPIDAAAAEPAEAAAAMTAEAVVAEPAAPVEIPAPIEMPAPVDMRTPVELPALVEVQASPSMTAASPAVPSARRADPIDATQPIVNVRVTAFDLAGPGSIIAESASTLAATIGAELAKDIRVTTRGLEKLPSELVTKTQEVVLQLVRNAAVHGIEAPAHRTVSGKHSHGTINIEVMADPQAGTWELSIEDDGRGISRDRLRATAVRRGMMTEDQAKALDGVKLIALLFKPGFTTAEGVTAHAGRGLGMGIVKATVEELGGRIGVATKAGRFTRFRISLPMTAADEVAA